MIYRKKSRSHMAVIIFLILTALLLGACGEEHSEGAYGDIHLYFVDSNQTKLVTMTYGLKSRRDRYTVQKQRRSAGTDE